MAISPKSLKREIYAEYQMALIEIQRLEAEIELMNDLKKSELISPKEYLNDFQNRSEIHNKEMNLLFEDLIWLRNQIQKGIKKINSVELFPIK
jgi:hypothetical protein